MINLIARLPGRRTDRILITGHYDTKIIRDSVFVGASDGASSAAMLIELARVLKTRPHEFTYEFIWFDGEEAVCKEWDECGRPGVPDNTYGSRYYVEAARKANAFTSIKTMMLLDMVGAKDLKLRRDTDFSAAWLNDIVWATAKRLGHPPRSSNRPAPSAAMTMEPFAKAGIPTIDLIDSTTIRNGTTSRRAATTSTTSRRRASRSWATSSSPRCPKSRKKLMVK